MKTIWRLAFVLTVFAGVGLEGCHRRKPPTKLTIAAASNLRVYLKDFSQEIEKAHPDFDFQIIYGASGNLYAQIQQGAPFDLFLSADTYYPLELYKAGLTQGPPKNYARGRLALWTSDGEKIDLSQGMKVVTSPQVERIAVANPKMAPYGKWAIKSLRHFGLYEKVKSKIVYGKNVSQALQLADAGHADLAIIPVALTYSSQISKTSSHYLVPSQSHPPLLQAYVILKRSETDEKELKKFIDFFNGPGRKILKEYGYEPVKASGAEKKEKVK